ncbi:MAG: hypothetical protein F6K31_18745 [Symploca sp. SIO2G7]|nr:hypothetical protein [Symploca sp. SIO2G7]
MKLRFKIFQHQSWLIISSLALAMGLSWSQPIRAEGSRELTSNGGFRPFLDSRGDNDPVAPVPRRTTIQVYVEEGETINLGSSANGVNNGVINYTDPLGNENTCPVGDGQILTRAQEMAGPQPNAGGYNPCEVLVGAGEDGIWTIEFIGPTGAAGTQDPDDTAVNNLPAQGNNDSFVSAWDVTVRGGAGNTGPEITGRAYATYLPFNMGASGVNLNSITYIQTERGDLYRMNLNGLDPFGFIFFANNKGFTDANGDPLFRSVPRNPVPIFHPPNVADTADDITHKIFFNPPNADLPEESTVALTALQGGDRIVTGTTNTFVRQDPPPPPSIDTLSFVGVDGTPGRADPTRGGNFSFNIQGQGADETGRFVITIDVNRNGILGDGNDVILSDETVPGLNTVNWNGQDGNGELLPAGNTPYDASINFIIGDVHFPFFDPESNQNGFILDRVDNATGMTSLENFIYYNDTGLVGNNPTDPISALNGQDSSNGGHIFGDGTRDGFGNNNGIDTWTSLVRPEIVRGLITISKADLTINKTVSAASLQAGSPVTYTLRVRSLTNAEADPALIDPDTFTDIEGATVTDTIPDAITNVTWTCAPSDPATAACGTASGAGNDISLTVDLDVGAEATITINGTISPIAAGGTVQNTAEVAPPPDTFDPTSPAVPDPNLNNNSSSAELTIIPGPIQPVGTKSSALVNDADGDGEPTPGDTLEYTVIYRNNDGTRNVTAFVATDTIDTSLVTFVPGSYTFAAANGAEVTANPTFNGSTDNNLTSPTSPGTLPPGGSEITMTYQVTINDIPVGTEIMNQAVASSTGGTLENVVTDASAGTGDLPQVVDDGVDTGNLPDTADDEPTIVTVGGDSTDTPDTGPTTLVLVKRITNAQREGVTIPGVNFGIFVDDPNDTNDNLAGWSGLSTGALVGVSQLDEPLASGDVVEYTIYFLAEGGTVLENVRLCDPIPDGTVFVPNSFTNNSGIAVNQNGATSNITNAADADQGQFFSPLAPVDSPPCPNSSEPQGAVLVNLGSVVPISPSNVGFVRFRIRIE